MKKKDKTLTLNVWDLVALGGMALTEWQLFAFDIRLGLASVGAVVVLIGTVHSLLYRRTS